MAILQHRIQSDTIVLFREVLAGDADLQATIEQRAIDTVMVPAPRRRPAIMLVTASFTGPVPRANCNV